MPQISVNDLKNGITLELENAVRDMLEELGEHCTPIEDDTGAYSKLPADD